MTPRARLATALQHQEPDRVPTDFLATPEVWRKLNAHLHPDVTGLDFGGFMEPEREALLRHFEIDSRVLSYDMFCAPPESVYRPGAQQDWWSSLDRSTPNRMWRQKNPDGTNYDIWGAHRQKVEHQYGAYEEFATYPLATAESVSDLKNHPWPTPEWWDFSALPSLMRELDKHQEYHLRFRIGSVFEIAWQLRGMQEFLMDLASHPEFPLYVMDRLTEVYVENLRRVLEIAGDRLDMVYFYDDVAMKNSLMISRQMWADFVRPRHKQLVDLAHAHGKKVMYHCDGAIYALIPDLIELGIDLLNPIQPDAKNMEAEKLKREFGDKLAFHGGLDIIGVLPTGTPDEVRAAVKKCVNVLGEGGGYVLCSSHHIQSDTPVENILAMYEVGLRG